MMTLRKKGSRTAEENDFVLVRKIGECARIADPTAGGRALMGQCTGDGPWKVVELRAKKRSVRERNMLRYARNLTRGGKWSRLGCVKEERDEKPFAPNRPLSVRANGKGQKRLQDWRFVAGSS